MAEIKTCEHYVVERLMELENVVDRQEETITELSAVIDNLTQKLDFIRSIVRVQRAVGSDDLYINFDNQFEKYEPEGFDKVVKMFGLQYIVDTLKSESKEIPQEVQEYEED